MECARAHGDATIQGDSKNANKSHDALIEALHGIKKFGTEGDSALQPLLDEENQSIRCWAASHLLNADEERAVHALEKLVEEDGIIAFTAEMVLVEWRNGTLEIP